MRVGPVGDTKVVKKVTSWSSFPTPATRSSSTSSPTSTAERAAFVVSPR